MAERFSSFGPVAAANGDAFAVAIVLRLLLLP